MSLGFVEKRSEAHLCKAGPTAKLGLLEAHLLEVPDMNTESKRGDTTLVKRLQASQRRDQCLLG